MTHITKEEQMLIQQIIKETAKNNIDNIARTNAYFNYFKRNSDITWAFLASMVSRNGGWNMCDLEGAVFPQFLTPKTRKQLFLTYERANWLIFHDVFPQLLLYQYSTKVNRPLFHLLPFFHTSAFIQREWGGYWRNNNQERLTTALIINEQNVIQEPVIEHPVFQEKIFQSFLFSIQDFLHFSCVLFPTCGGELYGASVYGFKSVAKRINLGKRLARILFEPRLFPYFFEFAEKTAHTGSRYDYEQYFRPKGKRDTPFLRTTFPVINHHRHQCVDWSLRRSISPRWLYFPVRHEHPIHLTDWYTSKKHQIGLALFAKKTFHITKRI